MTVTELDPITIRQTLETHRKAGHPWETAWRDAAGTSPQGSGALYCFMESHFRAAYLGTPSSLGRCRVAERDTHTFTVPHVHNDGECRSGAGCDRPATHGRFMEKLGPMWCEHHALELQQLSTMLRGGRANGHYTIYGTEGQAAA